MIGIPLTILDSVDSSNNYAIAQATQGLAQHGAAYMAKHQTAGKGQRGKQWSSDADKNIALSVLLNMNQSHIANQFALSTAVALSAFDLFNKYSVGDASIKWPNDIYWRDRKAVGILIENSLLGQKWQWAVAGIGINVNQTAFDPGIALKAVSLKQITGMDFDCVELCKELCTILEIRFQQFMKKQYKELNTNYNQYLFRANTFTPLLYKQQVYQCLIKEVDLKGRLWIQGAPVPFFEFGEVQWII